MKDQNVRGFHHQVAKTKGLEIFKQRNIRYTSIVVHHSKITTSLKTDFIKLLVCYLGTDKTVIYKKHTYYFISSTEYH